jgi:hypothetical protein
MGESYIRFEDEALQSALLKELDRASIHYLLDDNEAVRYGEAEELAVLNAAHVVRDALFPWYFLKWPTESQSERFRAILEDADIRFFVEHHEDGIWFVVRRADQAELKRLWPTVLEET